jgi:hypothetical protein
MTEAKGAEPQHRLPEFGQHKGFAEHGRMAGLSIVAVKGNVRFDKYGIFKHVFASFYLQNTLWIASR